MSKCHIMEISCTGSNSIKHEQTRSSMYCFLILSQHIQNHNDIKWATSQLGDNCIQNFHLGRYIVGYTVGNLVLRRRVSGAVKRDFRTYIRRYTSPNENFEYGYPHSNALLTFSLQKDSENVLFAHIRPATPAA